MLNLSQSKFPYAHHDGSELYLSNLAPKIGEIVNFRFRAPKDSPIRAAILRLYHDGEPRFLEMKVEKVGSEQWWSVDALAMNLKTCYRFIIITESATEVLNASGVHENDVTSAEDFQLLATPSFPSWIRRSVFYQIFPDRFASTGKYKSLKPAKFVTRSWNEIPEGRSSKTGVEYFGGDLDGVTAHLDHLERLGVNGLYFTPFFPANSTHRYDASSFDEVDPLLGGNSALINLQRVASKRGIRILGDLTTNHCGAGHYWIKRALSNKRAGERAYFYWDKSVKHGYEGWWGLASLPKLNYNSVRLRRLMYEGKNSIVKRWLQKPFSLSGWRIDVGNMTGRYRSEDIHDEIVLGVRQALDEINPDAWLVAENADHFPKDLDGFGWHGTMNYNGFMRPIWGWLQHNPKVDGGFFGVPMEIPKYSAKQMVASMVSFSAGIPWRCFTSSMLLLDSHDTARFRNVVGGDTNRHIAGMGLLMTYPGVPSIFAGDEIGLEGAWGEDARRTIDWSGANWDNEFFDEVAKLVWIRRNSSALADGGLRWIHIEDDCLVYARESKKERFLVVVARSKCRLKLPIFDEIVEKIYGAEVKRGVFKSQVAAVGIYRLGSSG
jgi:alpha-glucosidase